MPSDYEDRLKAKLEAVGLVAFDIETGRLKQDLAIHRRLIKALATTGPSLRECPQCKAVEEVLVQWRGQHWVYTKGEAIRRTCIEELEAALKGEAR